MLIENAKYGTDPSGNNVCVICDIDGEHSAVPMEVGNRHYDEIMRQVAAGTLTIKDAD
jgi:hypothetical protein|tara:strand:- start:41 stop:214 length:174 start_codon:yes stop_codon:yes gene_type:complete